MSFEGKAMMHEGIQQGQAEDTHADGMCVTGRKLLSAQEVIESPEDAGGGAGYEGHRYSHAFGLEYHVADRQDRVQYP